MFPNLDFSKILDLALLFSKLIINQFTPVLSKYQNV